MAKTSGMPSRSAEAYEVLRHDLIAGTLAPGEKLILADLQDRYGIGAMPLREALNRLAAEQFVVKNEGRGFSVPPLDAMAFLEIQNARIVIEAAALRETIAERTREWEDRLVLAFYRLSKSATAGPDFLLTQEWSETHAIFHRELLSGSRNTWLLSFAGQLFEQSARYRARRRQIDAGHLPGRDDLVDEHREIMDAAIAGDSKAATAKLVEHYRRSVETVLGETVELSSDGLRFFRRG
ncbi:GntR family transcriptional regulator [Nitratireductor luteus]|uniref:GntR family transcriptional regulator n=1 Tax=Nitratireductor luteus TaxID=2976980 RepID=UPI00223FBC4A|nr:GntR family transcriptional regulator [Nitratireductor luteus]